MATILIKRGLQTNISNLTLEYGEIALAYNADKTAIALYAGDGNGNKILINPDVSGDITGVLSQAEAYTDTQINNLVNGAPEAMDTLKELADAISANSDIMTALQSAIGDKVDKVEGMGLSSNDYTDAEKTKLAGIETGAQVNTVTGVKGNSESSYRTGNINITKANIGLGNVDNTSDADKPVSTATQAALDDKVDAVDGMGLSTNDYTDAEKTKLAGISEGANAYTHPTYTARTGVPTSNQTPAFGGTFTISQPVSDATGHITAINSRTVTVPSTVATTSAAGLMSAADKTALAAKYDDDSTIDCGTF